MSIPTSSFKKFHRISPFTHAPCPMPPPPPSLPHLAIKKNLVEITPRFFEWNQFLSTSLIRYPHFPFILFLQSFFTAPLTTVYVSMQLSTASIKSVKQTIIITPIPNELKEIDRRKIALLNKNISKTTILPFKPPAYASYRLINL